MNRYIILSVIHYTCRVLEIPSSTFVFCRKSLDELDKLLQQLGVVAHGAAHHIVKFTSTKLASNLIPVVRAELESAKCWTIVYVYFFLFKVCHSVI